MKKIMMLFLIPILGVSQTQIGGNINGDNAGDESGYSVSLSSNGNILAVGAPNNNQNGENSGLVKIFENNSGNWSQIGSDILGEAEGDLSGRSVALSADGSIVAIGAPNNSGNSSAAGHVKVYERSTFLFINSWTQLGGNIDGQNIGGRSGGSVSLSEDGKTLAIGAPFTGQNSGQVRVYNYNSGVWNQVGNPLDGISNGDFFGNSVSISADGNFLAVGANRSNINGSDSGQVRVFENNSGSWTQIGSNIDGAEEGDRSGFSVSISDDGNTLAIGSLLGNSGGANSGTVRVYENNSGSWVQVGTDISGEAAGDRSGTSVSISSDGSILAIGAAYNDLRIFKNMDNVWTQLGEGINIINAGVNISLSSNGDRVAIGMPSGNVNGNKSGQTKVYDLSSVLSSDNFVIAQLSLYPNPATHQVNINLNKGLILEKVNVYSSIGQRLKVSTSTQVDVSNLAAGSYFFEVITNKGKATKTIIVK